MQSFTEKPKSILLIPFKFVHPACVPTFLFAVSVINQDLHLICDERLFLRFTQFGGSFSTVYNFDTIRDTALASIDQGHVSQLKGFLKFVVNC